MKRTPGLSNPVDPVRAFVDKYADDEHSRAAAGYVQKLEQRDRARSWAARIRARLAQLGRTR
jgi:hypothetical protein